MKVILLQNVAKIGQRGEIATVPDGYALNKLIPKRMAEPATAANQKRIAKLQADAVAGKEALLEKFKTAVAALNEKKITIEAEANDQGHLFKAVHENEIAAAAVAVGVEIDVNFLRVKQTIKEVGEHVVEAFCGKETDSFTIEVVKK